MQILNETLKSSGSAGAGTWIFLAIFFGIIIVLILVAIIGSKKDKNEKLIENDKRRKIRTASESNRIILFISLNETIEILNKELSEFKPSIGTKSLGDINKSASDIIKKIIDSKELKEIYALEDFKNEIKPILSDLNKNKPSTWKDEAWFALTLVQEKSKAIVSSGVFLEEIKLGKEFKWS